MCIFLYCLFVFLFLFLLFLSTCIYCMVSLPDFKINGWTDGFHKLSTLNIIIIQNTTATLSVILNMNGQINE